MDTDKIDNLVEKSKKLKTEFQKQILTYMVAGLSLVAGLAWNELIKDFIKYIFPFDKNSLLAKLIYAILITLIVIFFALYIAKKEDKK